MIGWMRSREMKPKNFPARKLQRQINAKRDMAKPYTEEEIAMMGAARNIRTKKNRSGFVRLTSKG